MCWFPSHTCFVQFMTIDCHQRPMTFFSLKDESDEVYHVTIVLPFLPDNSLQRLHLFGKQLKNSE